MFMIERVRMKLYISVLALGQYHNYSTGFVVLKLQVQHG